MDFKTFLDYAGVITAGSAIEPEYKNLDSVLGMKVWICDFRFNENGDIKPLRNVEPTEVMIFSNDTLPINKKVYYSPVHFKPVKNGKVLSKIIGPYDNTGHRTYPGTSLNIFFTKAECYECYLAQCDHAIGHFSQYLRRVETEMDQFIQGIIDLKGKIKEGYL